MSEVQAIPSYTQLRVFYRKMLVAFALCDTLKLIGLMVGIGMILQVNILSQSRLLSLSRTAYYVNTILEEQMMNQPQTIGPMKLNQCYLDANKKHIQNKSFERLKLDLPLFSSIVATPPRVHLKSPSTKAVYWTAHFTLRHFRKRKHDIPQEWRKDGTWHCDGRLAVVVSNGCPAGSGISIQCPQKQNEMVYNITVYNYTFYVHDHVLCERHHPLKTPPLAINKPNEIASSVDDENSLTVAAAVIVFRMDVHRALEWITYHRIIGIDHFFLYMMNSEAELAEAWWPDLPYVTYVPWNLTPLKLIKDSRENIFLYQAAAQNDIIHRGRVLGLHWITYNDMDEYLVLKGNYTLKKYLSAASFPVIQGETVAFGNGPGITTRQTMLLNYTYRSVATFGKVRCKSLIRPTHVDYYDIHWARRVTGPIHMASPQAELWFHHYKSAEKGPFVSPLHNKALMEDTSLRDQWLTIVKSRVDDILSRKDENVTARSLAL
jgi:hypothetical protein